MKCWGKHRVRDSRWWKRATRFDHRGRRARPCRFEWLQDRILLCGDGELATTVPIDSNGVIVEEFNAGEEVGVFKVTLTQPGRFTVETRPAAGSPLETRTSLTAADGRLLIHSDGQSANNRDDLIVQHLLAGTYLVKVEGLGGGAGEYALVTQFEPASPPNEPLRVNFDRDYPFGLTPVFHVTADFNGDRHLDIATPNTVTNDVSVLLGLGDGTFQSAINSGAGEVTGPFGIVTGDFNSDGIADLATANQFSNDVSVLLGSGSGTFASLMPTPVGTFPGAMSVADWNGDGRLDLAVANMRDNDISILFGRGDGTFQAQGRFATGKFPSYLATGDFDGNGRLDLVVANFNSNDLSLLLGLENGTFAPEVRFASVTNPSTLVTGDFNRDGHLDLAGVNTGSNDYSLHWGRGDGTFFTATQGATGAAPIGLVSSDFNGDGLADLAASNRHRTGVSIFLALPDGTFQDQVQYRAGLQPWYVNTGDFNEDGHMDLATANSRSHDVSILLGLGDGTFQQDPTDARQGETNPQGMVARDFNGDGYLDLAAVSYTGGDLFVFLGRGDGTFQERVRFGVGSTPVELLAEDFNHDGRHDLATINCDAGNFSVLLGRGDGTFQDEVRYGSSLSGEFGVPGDFNRDGHIDLVVSGQFASGIAIALGRGDGTFGERTFFATDEAPADGASGDFNGDGWLDLATTNFFSPDHDISVHLGLGDGTFEPPQHYPVGEFPLGIVSADFNQDGHLDLVNANFRSEPGSVSLLLGRGDGTFHDEVRFETGHLPDFLLTRDFDGDGRLDLVVSNAGTKSISVLPGRADGTFADQLLFAVGDGPTPRRGLDAGDLNGDGLLDLAIPQVLSNDIAVLLGSGDGRFEEPLRFPVGLGPVALAVGDFSGDSRVDVASVNPSTNELTISLGAGNTTLLEPRRLQVGVGPVGVVQGDFNRDGRLDLAAVNHGSNDVSLLLGLGTGAFRDQQRMAVGANPTALVTGDFNADGQLDLATANSTSRDVSILLGRGDGTFLDKQRALAGDLPQSLVTGDFNGDSRLDLATANYRSSDVTVLFGRGDGTFQPPLSLAVGAGPVSLLASDFSGDGALDLVTANYLSHDVSMLLGRGDGTFRSPVRYSAGTGPISLTSSDFNGDGRSDLGVANSNSDSLTLLVGRGDGSFADPLSRPTGDYPAALVAADFNGDARADLAIATQLATDVAILQGLGDMTFAAGGTISNPQLSAPLVADWNGDGALDVALLDVEGRILLRATRSGAPGFFDAPRIVNPDPQFAARDLAVVSTQGDFVVAALDAKNASLSFYSRQLDGTFAHHAGPQLPGKLPVAIRSGDLNGDGQLDLVVAAAGSDQVFVFLQTRESGQPAHTRFAPRQPDFSIDVGVSPSSLELADVDGDQRLDILVTNQFSGDLSVLYNHRDDPFSCELRVRTGIGLHGLVDRDQKLVVRSLQSPTDVVAGHFDSDDLIDLVVTNSGANSVSILAGNGSGVLNPTVDQTFATDLRPTVVVTGRFNGDPYLDFAVLNEGSANLSIFLGTSSGGMTEQTIRPGAGNMPTGLASHDVNGDGQQDLLIGNDFGDLLILLGNGNGTFQPYQRADGRVALAVADLDGDGREDFIFASQANDSVEVDFSQSGDAFRQFRDDGLLAPEAVATADLNRDGALDLVVANSGANNVLVYLGTASGQFGTARSFFAGTRPVGVTVEDLNQDGLADLVVANEGSNDVTILLGQSSAVDWTLDNGPRLRAGTGPVQTIVRDETRDGVPDILVTNQQSNNVFLLAGLGLGFFDDRNPVIRQTGEQPSQLLPVGGGLITINQRSNDVTFFSNFLTSSGLTVGSGGQRPVAGLSGEFNGDRFSDLLVAHQGNGVVRLLAGGPDGFALGDSFFHDDLPHPAAIASVFRGQQIEVYGLNERGSRAVLITALVDSVSGPPALSPLPLSGLLLAVGPGFELAMSALTAGVITDDPQAPRGISVSESAISDAPTTFAEASGSEEQGSKQEEPDAMKEQEQKAHDAAIMELLAGVDDALALRPPKLPLDESFVSGLAAQAAADRVGGEWLSAALAWIKNADFTRLLGLLPLPANLPAVPGAVLAATREWFQEFLSSALSTIFTGSDKDGAPAAKLIEREPATTALSISAAPNSELWDVDSWLAAIYAAAILRSSWARERKQDNCPEKEPGRARLSKRVRPSS